jgi:hypothetical protein
MHDAVKIDGGQGAVLQIVAFAAICVAVFQDSLHDHFVETSVAHNATFVFL